MRIAILGGSFDPPHLGHLSVARQVKSLYRLDEIWLIPCFQHAFDKKLSPAHHRLAMTKLLEEDGIRVSDWEVKKPTMSISIETLREVSTHYGHTFSWIIGSDQLQDFPKWHEWERIINDFGLIVFPRGITEETVEQQIIRTLNYLTVPSAIRFAERNEITISHISSTEIRQRLKNGLAITNMVTPAIEAYIIKHKLYSL